MAVPVSDMGNLHPDTGSGIINIAISLFFLLSPSNALWRTHTHAMDVSSERRVENVKMYYIHQNSIILRPIPRLLHRFLL